MSLNSDMRQNIQRKLDFSTAPTGEARKAGGEEDESLVTMNAPESPARTDRLMEEILDGENLKEALRRVKANKGSPGVDGITVNQIDDYLKQHWPAIREQLLSGTYKPKPVKRVEIPKPDGGVRNSAFRQSCVDSSSRRSCRFCNSGGTRGFPIIATVFDRGDRRIRR